MEEVAEWLSIPAAGAVVTFTGNVRDHSEGRVGVESLTYEAYEAAAERRLAEIAAEARHRWPEILRLAMLHRTGTLSVGETAVVVGVSSAHRGVAFAAAGWGIDTLKSTVPIWKQETHAGGTDWGTDCVLLGEVPR